MPTDGATFSNGSLRMDMADRAFAGQPVALLQRAGSCGLQATADALPSAIPGRNSGGIEPSPRAIGSSQPC